MALVRACTAVGGASYRRRSQPPIASGPVDTKKRSWVLNFGLFDVAPSLVLIAAAILKTLSVLELLLHSGVEALTCSEKEVAKDVLANRLGASCYAISSHRGWLLPWR